VKAERGEPIEAHVLDRVSDYQDPRIVGIMSGKFGTTDEEGSFHHAGLSYFTRVGYISELIKKARDSNWRRDTT
jgi:hypothetical protein